MTYSLITTLLIICPLVFLACFIDSIAGGGGIITIPAYMAAGLPIHMANGTNKFVMTFGTSSAAVNYLRTGCVKINIAIIGVIGSLIGAVLGTKLQLMMSQRILEILLIVMLPLVAIFMFFNKGFGSELEERSLSPRALLPVGFAVGFVMGTYDGFFGPGCGMFLTLALVAFEKLDMIHATGTGKLINWASNFSSAITFALAGKVEWRIVVPCIICAVAGNILGSQFAIKKGSKGIKPVLAIVALLLLIKIIYQFVAASF